MKLKELSINDMEPIRQWRNEQLQMLRTSFPLTKEMQEDFYNNVICNRQSNSRYWGIYHEIESTITECSLYNETIYFGTGKPAKVLELIGMCGIENIQWENRVGEISLLLNTEFNIDQYLNEALDLILNQGFNYLNLENIYTEVYECSHLYEFWNELAFKYNFNISTLPNRKFYNGIYYDSQYINFNKERYNENTIS